MNAQLQTVWRGMKRSTRNTKSKKEIKMNCCNADGECNQYRGCPVRVASVGYGHHEHPERLLDGEPYTFERVIEWACWVILAGVLGLMVVIPCVYLLLRE